MSDDQPTLRINLQTWLSLLALGIALWLAIDFSNVIAEVSKVIFGAILLSLVISPLADLLNRWRIPRGVTVLIAYTGLGAILFGLGNLLIPVINSEIAYLQTNGSQLVKTIFTQLTNIPLIHQWLPTTDTVAQNITQRLDTVISAVINTLSGVGGLGLNMLLILVLGYFLAVDAGWEKRLLTHWISLDRQARILMMVARLRRLLTHWVWAQIALAFYFALVFSIGLALLGIPFAFTIGFVGGALEIIPYIGGLIALILAVFSGLTVNPWNILWVIIFYGIVVEVEAHILAPALYGRVLKLHPAVALITLFIGAKAAGIAGIFFAIPIIVVITAILQDARPEPEASLEEEETT